MLVIALLSAFTIVACERSSIAGYQVRFVNDSEVPVRAQLAGDTIYDAEGKPLHAASRSILVPPGEGAGPFVAVDEGGANWTRYVALYSLECSHLAQALVGPGNNLLRWDGVNVRGEPLPVDARLGQPLTIESGRCP